jgi:hypothetical protein
MSAPENPLPVNFDWPTPAIGGAGQNGTIELLLAQAEWIARVGIAAPAETNPPKPTDDPIDER